MKYRYALSVKTVFKLATKSL